MVMLEANVADAKRARSRLFEHLAGGSGRQVPYDVPHGATRQPLHLIAPPSPETSVLQSDCKCNMHFLYIQFFKIILLHPLKNV